jgi:hypothetical protein
MSNIRHLRLIAGKKQLNDQEIVVLVSTLPKLFSVVERAAELLTVAITEDGYLRKRYVSLFDAIEQFRE